MDRFYVIIVLEHCPTFQHYCVQGVIAVTTIKVETPSVVTGMDNSNPNLLEQRTVHSGVMQARGINLSTYYRWEREVLFVVGTISQQRENRGVTYTKIRIPRQ